MNTTQETQTYTFKVLEQVTVWRKGTVTIPASSYAEAKAMIIEEVEDNGLVQDGVEWASIDLEEADYGDTLIYNEDYYCIYNTATGEQD